MGAHHWTLRQAGGEAAVCEHVYAAAAVSRLHRVRELVIRIGRIRLRRRGRGQRRVAQQRRRASQGIRSAHESAQSVKLEKLCYLSDGCFKTCSMCHCYLSKSQRGHSIGPRNPYMLCMHTDPRYLVILAPQLWDSKCDLCSVYAVWEHLIWNRKQCLTMGYHFKSLYSNICV